MKKVSIIIPVYKAGQYIARCIESVLAQTYPQCEMLIIDDGSKDNSADIIQEYCKKDTRIRLIQQPNGGSAAARNHGIREAVGSYIVLLDCDDIWEREFLEAQLAFMKEKDAVCVYSSYRRIDEDGKECLSPLICRKSVTYKDMKTRNYIGCLTGVYDCRQYGKIYLHEELKSIRDDYA